MVKYPYDIWKRRLCNEYDRMLNSHSSSFDFTINDENEPTQYMIHYKNAPSYYKPDKFSEPKIKKEHSVEITLDREFPSKHPVAKMVTSIFHPNVAQSDKTICIAILGKWKETFSVLQLVTDIETLFWNPNPGSPYDSNAAGWVKKHPLSPPVAIIEREKMVGKGPRIVSGSTSRSPKIVNKRRL